jgi:hypothetical protein
MTNKPTAGPWHLATVVRTDSGGTLWNAVHASGVEYLGTPSYDAEAMVRRVARLNRQASASRPVDLRGEYGAG